MVTTKKCNECKKTFPLNSVYFSISAHGKYGYAAKCRDCMKKCYPPNLKKMKEYYHEHRISILEKAKQERIKNHVDDPNFVMHGESKTKLYNVWCLMRRRCENSNGKDYKNYGKRGIKVCDDWKHYLPFRDWSIINGYSNKLTIDRIDNNGNYEPSNCRWVTRKEQNRNTRRNHYLTYRGETKTLCEWAEQYDFSYQLLVSRIDTLKWSIEKALTTPKRKRCVRVNHNCNTNR